MPHWSIESLAARFAEAATTAHRLPPARVSGYFNTWPEIRRQSWEALGAEPPRLRLPPPSPDQVERMVEATRWLLGLDIAQRQLIWMRAEGEAWHDIGRRFGCGRMTAYRRWQQVLALLITQLDEVTAR